MHFYIILLNYFFKWERNWMRFLLWKFLILSLSLSLSVYLKINFLFIFFDRFYNSKLNLITIVITAF